MSTTSEVRGIIINLLADGEQHTLEEIRIKIADNSIMLSENSGVIRSVLYILKKTGCITSPSSGIYQIQKMQEHSEASTEALSLEELRITEKRLAVNILELKNFDLLHSSDFAIKQAREKAVLLKKIQDLIHDL